MSKDMKRPTDAELPILRVLWDLGPSTVREVFHALSATRETGYTTVLKMMQIMTDKGLLERDSSVRPQVYHAVRTQRQVQRQLVGDLADRAFSGSPGSLALQALSSRKSTPEERERIRRLLDKLEKESS
ncbi:MAG: BlaI/MecI/CopY family transcriptional regulator [Planctomycetes bacterium]|nr:BlaI/MecI/CopY family transcriptional regulator [Planctomycetota bacterium]